MKTTLIRICKLSERWDLDNFPRFPPQESCSWEIPKIDLKTTSIPEPLVQIQNNFTEMIHDEVLCQNCLNGFVLLKKMATKALDNKHIKMTSTPEPVVYIQNNFTEMFLIKIPALIAERSSSAEQDGCQSSR